MFIADENAKPTNGKPFNAELQHHAWEWVTRDRALYNLTFLTVVDGPNGYRFKWVGDRYIPTP